MTVTTENENAEATTTSAEGQAPRSEEKGPASVDSDDAPIGRVWLVTYRLLTLDGPSTMDTWLGMPALGKPDDGLTIRWVEGVRQGLADSHGVESNQITFTNMIEMESLDGLPEGGV